MATKINNSTVLLSILLIVIITNFGYSQNSDLANWTTIALEYKLNKKWNFGIEEQLRLKEDISTIDKYFTQLNAEYSVSKKFTLGAGIRYIKENDTEGNIQGYENHFRFNADASYKHKINDFTLKYRFRYQNKNELGVSNSEGDYANQHIRFKTAIDYNFKNWKLDPEFSAEIFNHFEEGEKNGFDKYRLTLGTDYKFKKLGKISLFYRIEKELNKSIPKTTNIIGLKYTYTIHNK
ncbi:MAG: DUF2490 domain-containing protein [Lutibacter sp.]|uniref:DUF2490 domain-containing protein n=1 Tax=Lutibacter sp. TaxID=1925666 RepID=UPI001811CFCE|nr:DUF2490 domain-containing protein [Lutibacter sp.]MBT8318194.1 DUF2490 domain-containing protein [Lutibacter sp.]NNJ59054.1 DUF2490 domain-containing protein [Lutibacter sp.]